MSSPQRSLLHHLHTTTQENPNIAQYQGNPCNNASDSLKNEDMVESFYDEDWMRQWTISFQKKNKGKSFTPLIPRFYDISFLSLLDSNKKYLICRGRMGIVFLFKLLQHWIRPKVCGNAVLSQP